MNSPDWDKRYKEGFYSGTVEPHQLVKDYWKLLPARGRIVDIATGLGRDLLFLARHDYRVCGLDRSWEGLKRACEFFKKSALSMDAVQADAINLPFKQGVFDGVLVFYFLERTIMGELASLLRPGGVLFYETFLKRQNEIDRHRNPAFLLEDNELPGFFEGLESLFHEEGVFKIEGKERAVARYIGRKR